jgi:hypothetical protein
MEGQGLNSIKMTHGTSSAAYPFGLPFGKQGNISHILSAIACTCEKIFQNLLILSCTKRVRLLNASANASIL